MTPPGDFIDEVSAPCETTAASPIHSSHYSACSRSALFSCCSLLVVAALLDKLRGDNRDRPDWLGSKSESEEDSWPEAP